MTYDKPLKVGKRERYELSLTSWLAGETILTATVTPDTSRATLFQPADISGAVIGFLLDGVDAGLCRVHIDYTTATRSDCTAVAVVVKDC